MEHWAAYNTMGWLTSTADLLGNTTNYFYDEWGRVASVANPGGTQIPLYRSGPLDFTDHLLTTSSMEYANSTAGGWTALGTIGYVYGTSGTGLVPMYRLFKAGVGASPPANDHFFTTSTSEVTAAQSLGYTLEASAAFYVYTQSGTGRLPLYRLKNNATNAHVYTTNATEYNNASASTWTKEGIAAYVLSQGGTGGNITTTYTYDYNDNPLTVTDPNNITTTNTYDANGRPLTSTTGSTQVSYTYDDASNGRRGLLCLATDGNGKSQAFGYSVRNELTSVAYQDGTLDIFTYDANGNRLTWKGRDTLTTSYNYNSRNLLTDVTHPQTGSYFAKQPISFGYDNASRLTSMNDYTGNTAWTYDNANRLTQISSPQGTVNLAYDNADRLTSRQLVGIGTWQFGYDNADRVTSVTTPFNETTTIAYDLIGRPASRSGANGIVQLTSYDMLSRVTGIFHQSPYSYLPLIQFQYVYDAGGRVTDKRFDSDANWTRYYYDATGQLTRELHTNSTGSTTWTDTVYTYDNNGNRLTKTQNGALENYSYYPNTDRLQSVTGSWGTRAYTYDSRGQVTQVKVNNQTVNTLEWDYEGRLLTLIPYANGSPNSANTVSYRYNGLGLNVSKQDGTGTHPLTYSGSSPGSPLLYDGSTVYTQGLSERQSGASRFLLGDLVGSTTHLTAANGNLTAGNGYDAFGVRTASWGTMPSPLGYTGATGGQTDATSGLILMGHRHYDPAIGRFISPDPAQAGMNWYAYAGNNPVSFIDPMGLWRLGEFEFDSETVGNGLDTGLHGAASGFTFGLYDGGSHKNQIGFGGSQMLGLAAGFATVAYFGTSEAIGAAFSRAAAGVASMGARARAAGAAAAAALGFRPCFVAGTLVLMADGSAKPIEQIQQGDWVVTKNETTGAVEARQVLETYTHEATGTLVVTFANGQSLETTEHHPFFVEGRGWVAAKDLSAGSSVLTRWEDARRKTVKEFGNKVVSLERKKGTRRVYNFAVESSHSYFVGNRAQGWVWVHNDCTDTAARIIAARQQQGLGAMAGDVHNVAQWVPDGAARFSRFWHIPGTPTKFFYHDVVVVNGKMVIDPLTFGHENPVDIGLWWPAFDKAMGGWKGWTIAPGSGEPDRFLQALMAAGGRL